MTGALTRYVDIRADERRLALQTFGVLFGIIAGHTVLETARDALFLGMLPASRLTVVYLVLAAVGLVVPWYNARFVARFGRRDAAVFSLMVGAFGTTLLHFQPVTPTMVFVIYVWSGLLATVMVVQFWMLAAQLFTVGQSKRLFPAVAAGGVLGAVVGGAMAVGSLRLLRRGAAHVGSSAGDPGGARVLMLVAAGLFVMAAVVLTSIETDDRVAPVLGERPAPAPVLAGVWSLVREQPYVARIAVLAGLSTAALLATDYLFKFVARDTIPAAELGDFFAQYYALVNGVALLMQLFVAMRLVQRLGVVAALAVLPLCLVGGGMGILIMGGGLLVVLLTKGADGALRHSLHRVSSELLYLPLPAEVRDRSKSVIDSVVVRGAQAATAAGILAVASVELESVHLLATVVAVLAGAWILVAVTLRRRYLDLFRQRLSTTGGAATIRFGDLDLRSVESVMAALSSPDGVQVVAALELLAEGRRTKLVPALIFYHESREVLVRALELVPQPGRSDWVPHAERLLSHDAEPVRLGAARALGRAGQGARLQPALDDRSARIRAHAAFQLAQAEVGAPERHAAIQQLLGALDGPSGRALRLGLLEALEDDGDQRWVDVLLRLADSADGEVVEHAALAMARVGDRRFIPLLVQRLASRRGRTAVRQALAELGDPALDALEQALADPATPAAVLLHIPRAMAHFGTQRAADLLTHQLEAPGSGAVRFKSLRGLGQLAARPEVALDREAIERALQSNLRELLRLLALEVALGQGRGDEPGRAQTSAQLLLGLLQDKGAQAFERAMRLVKLLFPGEDIRGVFLALHSSDRARRANALEFLDALTVDLQESTRAMLRLSADDLSGAERLDRAVGYLEHRPRGPIGALSLLLADGDTALAALAAYHVRALGHPELAAELDELLDGRPSLHLFSRSSHGAARQLGELGARSESS